MTIERVTQYRCDYPDCGYTRVVAELPPGWLAAEGTYGTFGHACRSEECQEWLRKAAPFCTFWKVPAKDAGAAAEDCNSAIRGVGLAVEGQDKPWSGNAGAAAGDCKHDRSTNYRPGG